MTTNVSLPHGRRLHSVYAILKNREYGRLKYLLPHDQPALDRWCDAVVKNMFAGLRLRDALTRANAEIDIPMLSDRITFGRDEDDDEDEPIEELDE